MRRRKGYVILQIFLLLVLVKPLSLPYLHARANADPVVAWLWAQTPAGRIDPGGTIARGKTITILTQVSDPETAASELNVNISYRPQGGSWISGTPVIDHETSNYWYYNWDIPMDADLGLYDIKIDVEDPDGGTTTDTDTGEFQVIT